MAYGFIGAFAAFLIDQATKAGIVKNAPALMEGVPIAPGFNLIFLRNDGVSFGMLDGLPWWGLTVLAVAVCTWLVVLMFRTNSRVEALAYGMIIGGALGNVADRLRHRAVTDFLDFYAGSVHWPAFNLADTFIFCGVAVLLISSVVNSTRG